MPSLQEILAAKKAAQAVPQAPISKPAPAAEQAIIKAVVNDKTMALKDRLALLRSQQAASTKPKAEADISFDKTLEQAAPPKKLSLKEQLELKRQQQEQKELAEEPQTLPAEIRTEQPTATIEEHPEPAPIRPKEAVIDVAGKFMSVGEIQAELNRVQGLLAKIKSQSLVQRALILQAKLEELTNLIEMQEEVEAEANAPQLKPAAEAVAEVFNGEAPQEEGQYKGAFSLSIELNEKQIMARDLAMEGKSFCLIGAAGTGKTTAQRAVAEALLESDRLVSCDFKVQGAGGARVTGPSFVACAYTRRASNNLARAIHKNPRLEQVLRHNIMTIHALLEFEPVIFWDEEKKKESMRFEPQRNAANPLTITHLVIEEASMVSLDLWRQLYEALPVGVQIIFIGDLNQLPPVFGPSILNYALVQLPIIELTHVYRQAGDSLILENAHRILEGRTDLAEGPDYQIIRGKNDQQVGQAKMANALSRMFELWYDSGEYQPDEDMILSPFNKQDLGTTNMNKWIAQFLGAKRGAIVHEIIAGFNKHYLAVGDRVMVNKQDGYITKISVNAQYHGQEPQVPGSDLSRFGVRILGADSASGDDLDDVLLGYSNFSLEELEEQAAERKQQASHLVDILLETGQTVTLSAAGDFQEQFFTLGYVLTVHKAQGCEFRKVFLLLHKDHGVMLFRELLYTANTRAREFMVTVAKDWIIEKAIKQQRIKGNCLQDKLEYFNSGAVDMLNDVFCTKG